jgi:hypothetical protein
MSNTPGPCTSAPPGSVQLPLPAIIKPPTNWKDLAETALRWLVVAGGAVMAGHSHAMSGGAGMEGISSYKYGGGALALAGLAMSLMAKFQSGTARAIPVVQHLMDEVGQAEPLMSEAAMQAQYHKGLESRLQQAEEALKWTVARVHVMAGAFPSPPTAPMAPGTPLDRPGATAVPHPVPSPEPPRPVPESMNQPRPLTPA